MSNFHVRDGFLARAYAVDEIRDVQICGILGRAFLPLHAKLRRRMPRPRGWLQLRKNLKAETVAKQRAVSAIKRFAVWAIVLAAGSVIFLSRSPAAAAVAIQHTALVTQDESRVFISDLEHVRCFGTVLELVTASRSGHR